MPIKAPLCLWLTALLIACGAARAAELEVDLELALAIDVSGSVDEEEAMLQRNGYIAAFRHPSVVEAIQRGPLGRIAVSYYEWAGFGHMKIIAPWAVIRDKASAEAFADRLQLEPPQTARRTAIAAAISFGAGYFDDNGFAGRRRVLDISGDGPNNWGEPVTVARDRAIGRGITINGLPIVNQRPTFSGLPPMRNLDLYYRDCVIGGPGAFHIVASDFRDFGRAVLRKLILEIAGLQPAPDEAGRPGRGGGTALFHRVADPPAQRVAPPCEVGYRQLWRYFEGDDSAPAPLSPPPR
jgi:hypothetical protein